MTAYLAKRQYFELVAKNLSNLAEFIQIIGGKSIFERYNAAKSSIIGKVIDTQYQDFLAWPIIEDDRVEFHGIRSSEEPRLFSDLPEEE